MIPDLYIPKHFKPEELVDPVTYEMFKHHPELIYKLFNPDLLRWMDWMRERYGACTVNNWKYGGVRKWSGLRNPSCPEYTEGSMHCVGEAVDMVFTDWTAQAILADLKKLGNKVPYIRRIEDKPGMTWIHGDMNYNHPEVRPYYFKP